jgi:hypothetical protein
MKIPKKNRIYVCFFLIIILLNSCSSRSIKLVSPETKTEFGITLTAPSQGIFFVENEKVNALQNTIEIHRKTANSIYNKYGPASERRFVGKTNARQLKFNIKDKTYLIDVSKLKKRTAMILFNGKDKPIIEYDEKKYNDLVENYFDAKKK